MSEIKPELLTLVLETQALLATRTLGQEKVETYPAHIQLSQIHAIQPVLPAEHGKVMGSMEDNVIPIVPPSSQTAFKMDRGDGVLDVLFFKSEPRALAEALTTALVAELPADQQRAQATVIAERLASVFDPVPFKNVPVTVVEGTAGRPGGGRRFRAPAPAQ